MDKYKLGNPIRYKTFLVSDSATFIDSDKALSPKLTTIFEAKEGINPERVKRFIGTSESVDRDNEVVLVSGWDFKNYQKNPIVLWSHNHGALPIGKTVGLYRDDKSKVIYFDIYFSETSTLGKEIFALVQEGILKATSVGFRVLDWEWDEKAEAAVFTKSELFEISVCTVPANQDAVAVEEEGKAKELDEQHFMDLLTQIRTQIEEMNDRISSVVTTQVVEPTPTVVATTEPVDEVTTLPLEPDAVVDVVTLPLPIDAEVSETLLATIVQAVLDKINQTNQTEPTTVEPSPSDNAPVEEDAGVQPNPEPGEQTEEMVVVNLGDLDETESFVIIHEEEN